jgi:hypothetical protein
MRSTKDKIKSKNTPSIYRKDNWSHFQATQDKDPFNKMMSRFRFTRQTDKTPLKIVKTAVTCETGDGDSLTSTEISNKLAEKEELYNITEETADPLIGL